MRGGAGFKKTGHAPKIGLPLNPVHFSSHVKKQNLGSATGEQFSGKLRKEPEPINLTKRNKNALALQTVGTEAGLKNYFNLEKQLMSLKPHLSESERYAELMKHPELTQEGKNVANLRAKNLARRQTQQMQNALQKGQTTGRTVNTTKGSKYSGVRFSTNNEAILKKIADLKTGKTKISFWNKLRGQNAKKQIQALNLQRKQILSQGNETNA